MVDFEFDWAGNFVPEVTCYGEITCNVLIGFNVNISERFVIACD